jgi:hypothetical protein
MRTFRHICFLLLLAAFAATSCVYDFHPQIDGEGGYMIVEGNIIVGDQFDITTSWSWSLVDTTQGDERWQILASNKMHVEASDGTRYENQYNYGGGWGMSGSPRAAFDLREADPSLQYRLVIENSLGTYVSSWAAPMSPGQIDSLSYKISEDKTTMSILVAAHSDDSPESYYRWSVAETWEYHADVQSLFKYVEEGGEGQLVPLEDNESLYFCWLSGRRPEIMTGTTHGLTDDRLADQLLYTITNSDNRISILYRADVQQMRIPEEAYRYWQVMERNSNDVGGLFSPEPSELRGNVTCVERPEELVLGYVGVMSVARKRLEIDNYEARFYHQPYVPIPPPDTLNTPAEWKNAIMTGLAPVRDLWNEETGRLIGYEWLPVRCVDCRFKGGTKNRPADWPNHHY